MVIWLFSGFLLGGRVIIYLLFPETMVSQMAFEKCCYTNVMYQMNPAIQRPTLNKRHEKIDCILKDKKKQHEMEINLRIYQKKSNNKAATKKNTIECFQLNKMAYI